MEHAMQQGRPSVATTDLFEREDELAPVAGLRTAVLLGAGIWAIIIWCVFHFAL